MSSLHNRNVVVFGINGDTVSMHRDFSNKERLNFALLSDTDKKVISSYGVLNTNGLPKRVTFIIGPDGLIHGIDGNVDSQFTVKGKERVSLHGQNLVLLLADWKGQVGSKVPNFFVLNIDGKSVDSPIPVGSKASVIVLLSSRSPYCRAALPLLNDLKQNSVYGSVNFLAIDPINQESDENIKTFAKSMSLKFPLARDKYGEIMSHLKATKTPTVWVLNGSGTVAYTGAIYGSTPNGRQVNYVQEALNAILQNRALPVSETPVIGTDIQR